MGIPKQQLEEKHFVCIRYQIEDPNDSENVIDQVKCVQTARSPQRLEDFTIKVSDVLQLGSIYKKETRKEKYEKTYGDQKRRKSSARSHLPYDLFALEPSGSYA